MTRHQSLPLQAIAALACIVAALLCSPLWAQSERDPTVAPQLSPAAPVAGAAPVRAQPLPPGAENFAVLVRDGTPYLVSDTRLYAVGQTVGGFKIERITETEIWLRSSSKQLQKIQRFSGIQRRAAQP